MTWAICCLENGIVFLARRNSLTPTRTEIVNEVAVFADAKNRRKDVHFLHQKLAGRQRTRDARDLRHHARCCSCPVRPLLRRRKRCSWSGRAARSALLPGKRFCLAQRRDDGCIQAMGRRSGQVSDIEIRRRKLFRYRDRLNPNHSSEQQRQNRSTESPKTPTAHFFSLAKKAKRNTDWSDDLLE